MPQFKFDEIMVVPSGEEMINTIMLRTQGSQTPTVLPKNYTITRLRFFYMCKVRFVQQDFLDKLTAILDDFPRLESIPPFYSDLLHVLCHQNQYRIALGQVYTVGKRITKIMKGCIKLLKDADSLDRCECLQISAMEHMCTVIKQIGPSLAYLEQVRQHMAKMPSIEPDILERVNELKLEEGVRIDGEEGDVFEFAVNDVKCMTQLVENDALVLNSQ